MCGHHVDDWLRTASPLKGSTSTEMAEPLRDLNSLPDDTPTIPMPASCWNGRSPLSRLRMKQPLFFIVVLHPLVSSGMYVFCFPYQKINGEQSLYK